MMYFLKIKFILYYLILGVFFIPSFLVAETVIDLEGADLLPKANIFITPTNAQFISGSTFDVPIYIDTKGNSINAVNIKITFDSSRLSIIKPSGGKSILGIWLEPPIYNNSKGTASFVGIIPNGITTSAGLIATITFKAISSGNAQIGFTNYSSANLNDGVGSLVKLSLGDANYKIIPKIPEGVFVSSDTHLFQEHWYNNNAPVFHWDLPEGIKGFNYLFDGSPTTVPTTEVKDFNNSSSYENIKDGVWYFHVRANINGVWGNTSHFQVRIDTTKPAFFAPDISSLKDSSNISRYLLSFITTDSLSGIDYYEVGIINNNSDDIASPIFIQSESPYIVSDNNINSKVIIRAYDRAGNIRESETNLYKGVTVVNMIKKYALYLFMLATLILLLELILHYLFGHHIIHNIRKVLRIFRKISSDEKYSEIEKEIEMIDNPIPVPENTDKNTLN